MTSAERSLSTVRLGLDSPWKNSVPRVLGREVLSGQEFVGHLAGDVGEAKVAPGVIVGQALVVEAEQVKNSGMEVVKMRLVLHCGDTVLVGGAVAHAALRAAAGHPKREPA